MKYIYLLITSLCSFTLYSQAQVINGTWTGNYAKTLLSSNPKSLVIELSLYNDSMLTGASHLYYGNGKFEHHKIKGKYNPKDSSALFEESLVETNVVIGVFEVTYKVKLYSRGDHWQLYGNWKNSKSIFGYIGVNKVSLQKPKDSLKIKLQMADLDSIKADTVKAIVNQDTAVSVKPTIQETERRQLSRASDIQKIIEVGAAEKDSINITIYDNGEVDNDSVSLYIDDKPLLKKQGISDKPVSVYLSLDKTLQFQKLKMVAENLGTLPPNTAVMIITTKKKRYEVHMSSDLEKNAVVEFVLTE